MLRGRVRSRALPGYLLLPTAGFAGSDHAGKKIPAMSMMLFVMIFTCFLVPAGDLLQA